MLDKRSDPYRIHQIPCKDKDYLQWRGESKAAGEAVQLMPPFPPPVILFCLLVWDACHVVGTTCNDHRSLRNTVGWMGALQAPQQFHGRVLLEVQGARALEAPKSPHLTVPQSGSNISQQYVGAWLCIFSCALQYKVTGKAQRPKIFNSQVSYQKKMCMFYSLAR